MSFAKAAAELNVTPAALSYQIKGLEAHLEAPLFRRLNRAVELTEQGRILQPGVAQAFADLTDAWGRTRKSLDAHMLTVTAGPAFTAKVLAPRMFRFAAQHPEIELRFSATLRILDFARDEVDIGIRFGTGQDEGLFSEELYRGWISPMMRPSIADRISRPEDLLGETLIHDDSLNFLDSVPDWQRWFALSGVTHGDLKGPHFSQADHALDMALEGSGVVLGRSSIALSALHSGALVAPFPLAMTSEAHYRIVCQKGTEDRPAIRLFRDWIKTEMAAELKLADGHRIVMVD